MKREISGAMDIPFLKAEKEIFGTFSGREEFLKERIFYPMLTPETALGSTGGGLDNWAEEHGYGVYSEEALKAVRDEGFTSVWMAPGPLRDIVQTKVFPELGQGQEDHRRRLRAILERCQRLGLGLYMYFLEPSLLYEDDPFWRQHPDLMGDVPSRAVPGLFAVRGKHMVLMCTSTEQVRDYLRQGFAELARAFPGLRGTIHISATEKPTHCWSYGRLRTMRACRDFDPRQRPTDCPRCRERRPEEVIGELVGVFEQGIHSVDRNMRVIAWNWDWNIFYPDPQEKIVRALPEGVTFMSDFERGGIKESYGKRYLIDEYSLSYIGPSRKFTASTAIAREKGREIFAKLQIGTAYEAASMPDLPLMCNLHQKLVNLYRLGVNGTLATWAFGCSRTIVTHAFNRFCQDPDAFLDQDVFLGRMAVEYFGQVDTEKLIEAWRLFSLTFDLFPYTQRFAYWSPLNNAPAYALLPSYRAEPMDRRCHGGKYFNEDMGDRLRDSLIGFTLEEVISRFHRMYLLWQEGLGLYEEALAPRADDPLQERHRREELSVARAIPIHLRGTWNAYRMHRWKMEQAGCELWEEPHDFRLDDTAREIMRDEIDNAAAAIPIYDADPRLGFVSPGSRKICDAGMIREKVAVMEAALAES